MKGYSQFCPVALASELFAERWTPLILRELLAGARRFADLHRGMPRISRNLLSQRLSMLVRAGIIERKAGANGKGCEYHLTTAGGEFRSVIDALGTWGYKWCTHDLQDEQIDPDHLMWVLRRLVRTDNLPEGRVVVCFRFRQDSKRRFWLVLNRPEVDLCLFDPGFDVDLEVLADVSALAQICLGHLSVRDAVTRSGLSLSGPRQYCRALPGWLGVSRFAVAAAGSNAAR
jgi:DNA-binding HxlR family transcriptional regulator